MNGTDELQGWPQQKTDEKEGILDSNKKQVIFSFKPTTVDNVEKLPNEIDTKKAVVIHTIPPKIIKLTSNVLVPILTNSHKF